MRAKAVLIGVIIALGLRASLVALDLPHVQARPPDYREAVLRMLKQHNLGIRDVEVVDSCAPTVERCATYTGAVTIETSTRLKGQIACRERWTTCTLTVATAGIRDEPLPDVIDPLPWRWSQLRAGILEWLHSEQAKTWTTPRP